MAAAAACEEDETSTNVTVGNGNSGHRHSAVSRSDSLVYSDAGTVAVNAAAAGGTDTAQQQQQQFNGSEAAWKAWFESADVSGDVAMTRCSTGLQSAFKQIAAVPGTSADIGDSTSSSGSSGGARAVLREWDFDIFTLTQEVSSAVFYTLYV
jgi:hypothetical protein